MMGALVHGPLLGILLYTLFAVAVIHAADTTATLVVVAERMVLPW